MDSLREEVIDEDNLDKAISGLNELCSQAGD